MWPFTQIWNWIKGGIDKVKAFIKKAWAAASPFLKEIFDKTTQNVWDSLQDLAIEAAQYVATQGLPDDKAKQAAFKEYMTQKAKNEVSQLKDSQLNLLREMAVAIVKKISEQ